MAESLTPSERMEALARNDNPDANKTNPRRAARLRTMEAQMEEHRHALSEIETVRVAIGAWKNIPFTKGMLLAVLRHRESELRTDLKNLETTYSQLKS